MIPGRIGRLLCSRFCVGIFDTSELLRFCERSRNILTRSYIPNNSSNNRHSNLDDLLCAYSCKYSHLWITITWRGAIAGVWLTGDTKAAVSSALRNTFGVHKSCSCRSKPSSSSTIDHLEPAALNSQNAACLSESIPHVSINQIYFLRTRDTILSSPSSPTFTLLLTSLTSLHLTITLKSEEYKFHHVSLEPR